MNISSPPGSATLQELTRQLFVTWRRGGAWDEARTEPEVLRLAPESRDSSPAGVVREMVLEALKELGEGRWVPWSSLAGWLRERPSRAGPRAPASTLGASASAPSRSTPSRSRGASCTRACRRSASSTSAKTKTCRTTRRSTATARRSRCASRRAGARSSPTSRRRATASPRSSSTPTCLRVGMQARVGAILAIASFVEIGRAAETLDLIVAPQTLARALSAGLEADVLRARIEAIAPLPEALSRTLAQASVVVGRATWVPAAGFLWVEDANVREMLRTRRATQELFVDPSPPGGAPRAWPASISIDSRAGAARSASRSSSTDRSCAREPCPRRRPSRCPPPRLTPGRGTPRPSGPRSARYS